MIENDITYVQSLLKRFAVYVYTGNQLDDIALMEIEIKDLHKWSMITDEEYIKAISILQKKYNNLSNN